MIEAWQMGKSCGTQAKGSFRFRWVEDGMTFLRRVSQRVGFSSDWVVVDVPRCLGLSWGGGE